MPETIKIDFHCHSSFSDGEWSPEKMAQHCAEAGVRYAALTDHDTLEGLDRCEAACERHGLGFINGLELTALHGKKEIHLLCFGFDGMNASFMRVVSAVKDAHPLSPTYPIAEKKSLPELIQSVHQAGGIVLLAHPLVTEPDFPKLETLVAELLQVGLDGIEVYYSPSSPDQQEFLHELALQKGCVVSGGTDHHGFPDAAGSNMGVDIPLDEWKTFRDLLLKQRQKARQHLESPVIAGKQISPIRKSSGRAPILIWMVLPALAAVSLFTIALFGFFLPGYERALTDRKREMIRELTNTVWSMLDEAEKKVSAGQLSSADARSQVVERVRSLRYGREGKDYFWLQDLVPRMIMHPYRTDLEGQDLSG
ncbi:MAG: cache domain-containing protein, partial [Deltaproteobacteria bacterium]